MPELQLGLPEMATFPTCGPDHRYGAILFVEKEGFLPLFQAIRLAERHDLAIMSTKGLSNTAARRLAGKEMMGVSETWNPELVAERLAGAAARP